MLDQLDDIPSDEREDTTEFIIAADDITQADISGGFYHVDLPCPGADLQFRHFCRETFVDYLRTVFKWGGFPGWARSTSPLKELIAELTDGLEPI